MFDSKYKEEMERVTLSEDYKAELLKKMKSGRIVTRTRLVLVSAAAVLVLLIIIGLTTQFTSNGNLLQTMFGRQSPQTTELSTIVTQATNGTSDANSEETTPPTSTPTEMTEATPAPTHPPVAHLSPIVSATADENGVTVSWDRISSPNLLGYRVVASIGDSTPQYIDNGYYSWITDANVTSCTITTGDCYTNGDFNCFIGGQSYYFSVTAIYDDGLQSMAGNAIQVTMPASSMVPCPTCVPCPENASPEDYPTLPNADYPLPNVAVPSPFPTCVPGAEHTFPSVSPPPAG